MMHNTYSSCSSIISFRTSFGFNDYSYYNYYPNERCPSTYCSCCCSFNVNPSRLLMPMNLNPSVLYGLRQSALIQCPPSRRIVLGSSDRYCYRVSNFDVGSGCGGGCCCVKERVIGGCREKCCVEKKRSVGVDRVLGRSCKESRSVGVDRVLGRSCKESRSVGVDRIRDRLSRRERDFRCNALGDAEAMLSLLSGEVMEECVVVKEKKRKGPSKEVRIVREQNVASERSKGGKDNVVLGYSEGDSKKQSRSSRAHLSEEGCVRREKRESRLVDEDRRSGRRESTSSYYTVSDSGELESDTEVDLNEERYVEESSNSQRKDSRKTGSLVISEVNEQELKSRRDEKNQQLLSSRHENVRVGSSTEWDCRKKSEKKLDESSEGTSKKESLLHKSKVSQSNESNSVLASSLKSKLIHQEEESSSDVSSLRQSGSCIKKDNRFSEHSKFSGRRENITSDVSSHAHSRSNVRTDYQASDYLVSGSRREHSVSDASIRRQSKSKNNTKTEESRYLRLSRRPELTAETDRQNVETSTSAWRRSMQEEESAMMVDQSVQEAVCEHCRTCGRSMRENKMETEIQQRVNRSEIIGTTEVQSQSESGHREQEIRSSVREESKLKGQQSSTAQFDARVSAGQFSEIVATDYGYAQNTLRSQQQSETRMKNMEASSSTFTSAQYVERLPEDSPFKIIEEPQSSRVLQTQTTASEVHSTSEEINRHSASDKRLYDEQTYSTSKLKSVNESIEKRKLVDQTILLTSLITEVQGPVLQAGITGNFSGASQSSAPITSQPGELQVNCELQLPMTSSPYQLVESKSSDGESSSTFLRKDSERRAEYGAGNSRTEPQARPSSSTDGNISETKSPAGALGSAQRLQESSSQILGEFVEKMRHETSSSGTKMQKKLSQLDNRHLLKGSSQMDSDKAQLVKQGPGGSSEDPGIKGSGDEMEGVEDRFVEEAPESEALDGETARSVTARRTGKSLWNIVAGIFRLRWGSGSEAQKSSTKGSPQSSPTDSTGGETWFSGNELEEGNGDSMMKQEAQMLQEPTPSDHSLPRRSSFRSQKQGRGKTEPQSTSQEPTSSDQPLLRRIATKGRKNRRKIGEGSISPEPTSQQPLRRTTTPSKKGDSKMISSDENLSLVELDPSASSGSSQGGSLFGGMSAATNIDLNITQQTSVSSPVESLVPSGRRLGRSDAIEDIALSGSVLESLPIGGLNMAQQTLASSPPNLPLPSARQLGRVGAFEEIGEGSSASGPFSSGSETGMIMGHQTSVSSPQDVAVPFGRRLRRTNAFEENEEIEGNEEHISSSSDDRESVPPRSLVAPAGQLRRLDAFEEIVEAEKNEELNTPPSEQRVQSIDVMQSIVPVSEKLHSELKQRKLQRTNKVIVDRFDEWEDAYRRENEQRKVDEIFMREALAEAIKAADAWEVPVGAVLVHNGNIVARGYNLVEELRDSTAHAEMICIREASNVLRTWRLSETTLYVTLEPCPMCAGAILQARISTLVWGAPNKLLGADGSWIRLFPEGVEGEQRSEVIDKSAAPKHPFHPKMNIRRGVLESECAQTMQQFFQRRRKKEKERDEKSDEGQPSCIPVARPKLLHKMHGMFHIMFC